MGAIIKTVAFIFARGGSKGCPGKNIRMIAGKPLLAHAIEMARASRLVDDVVVSTDSDEIAYHALNYGANVLRRPAHLCADDSPEWLSWQHAVKLIECDVFVSVPTTCPLRAPADITKTIMGIVHFDAKMAFTLKRSREFIYGQDQVAHRQQLPDRNVVVGVCYAARAQFIRHAKSFWDTTQIFTSIVPEERALDIDTEFDFKLAKLIMESH